MDEARALQVAERFMSSLDRLERKIHDDSTPLVIEEQGVIREGLLLLHSAVLAAIPGPTTDRQLQAIMALAEVQENLIRSGWTALLEGHYASAAHPCRLIFEIIDYMPAASRSLNGAELLLANKEWRIGDARKLLEAELRSEDPALAEAWKRARMESQNRLQGVAHARASLLLMTSSRRGTVLDIGLAMNRARLEQLAPSMRVLLSTPASALASPSGTSCPTEVRGASGRRSFSGSGTSTWRRTRLRRVALEPQRAGAPGGLRLTRIARRRLVGGLLPNTPR